VLTTLFQVYLPLLGWTLLGFALQKGLPWRHWLNPQALGRFMFWVGVPLGTLGFMQTADLSGQLWAAPLVCWLATGLGYALASAWLQWQHHTWQGKKEWDPWLWSRARRGSFYLTATLGNTGYLGYPICLAVGGSAYFGWALFYDLLGTLFTAYGLGVWVASRYSASFTPPWQATLRVPKQSHSLVFLCRPGKGSPPSARMASPRADCLCLEHDSPELNPFGHTASPGAALGIPSPRTPWPSSSNLLPFPFWWAWG
jgi:predicted permease